MGELPLKSTPEEALRAAVDALGGLQRVGHLLKPECDPVLAGQWLSHCLTASLRDKLSLAQVALIFRRAFEAGHHGGFERFATQLGYRVVAIDPRAELEEMARSAEAHAQKANELSQEVLARMRHAHLKVE